MRFAPLAAMPAKGRQEIVQMGQINYSDQYREGDLRDSLNLSARRWPYITTRRARREQARPSGAAYSGVTALTAWGKLVVVQGTELFYDGRQVGTVTEGEKQFAMVNTKLVIWPDKVYLDMKTHEVKPLGASVTGSRFSFTKNSMRTDTAIPGLTKNFKAGDCVTISGCKSQPANNKDVVIKEVTSTGITVADNSFTAHTLESGQLKIERRIPELDFICESENRLWGCSSGEQTIYASCPGDPTNFFVYEGVATDAYALAVGSEGDFTGCCKLTSSVLFWKETKLHKLLGGTPAEYSLYTYDIEGLRQGCHKSLQVINDVLFYMGLHGVYAYSGGTPSLISANLGDRVFTGAVGGSDGDSYYLSVKEGESAHMLVYEVTNGIWVREDGARAVDFARIGKDLYFADDGGKVWLCDGGEEDGDLEWTAQFTPFYETVQGRKRYSKLLVRLELPRGSWLTAELRMDGGLWRECGKAVGREQGVTALRLPVNRCDKIELRLRGKGPCTILSVMREFTVGSDR